MSINNNPPECRTYLAVTVTLTTHDTIYNLGNLLRAINENYPLTGREVSIQIDPSVAGSVRVGDPLVSAVNCGYVLNAGESRTYRDIVNGIPAGMLNFFASADLMLVNVEIQQ